MHRDISGGNILLRPVISYDPKTRKVNIRWQGILADWELAKNISTEPQAKQPERTVRTTFIALPLLI